MLRRWWAPVAALLLALTLSGMGPARAGAEALWLDGPLENWNVTGAAVPAAPADGEFYVEPDCAARAPEPATAEEAAVADAGWRLFRTVSEGRVTAVGGTVGYDGMCRPAGFNVFVFVDGVYAGTIAPDVMMSRADGSGFVWVIAADGSGLTANFARYTDADPLCCPSRTSIVQYAVVDLGAGPVLTPLSVVTEDNVVG